MTEDTHRTWDIVFKCLGVVGVLASAWWTVYSYRQAKSSELQQQIYTQQKDDEARTKDQNSFIFQQQTTLYFEATRAAATLAAAIDPNSFDKQAIDAKTLQAQRERFEQLYWGDLVVVEDRRVEMAMVAFRNCMILNGKNCTVPTNNQYSKPISPEVLAKRAEPLLLNLSLELAACTRSALQEDRKIKFGAIKEAMTTCPYD